MWIRTDKGDGGTSQVTEARVRSMLEGIYSKKHIDGLMRQAKSEGVPLATSFAIYTWKEVA